jgi:hypothetical protein
MQWLALVGGALRGLLLLLDDVPQRFALHWKICSSISVSLLYVWLVSGASTGIL